MRSRCGALPVLLVASFAALCAKPVAGHAFVEGKEGKEGQGEGKGKGKAKRGKDALGRAKARAPPPQEFFYRPQACPDTDYTTVFAKNNNGKQ